MIGVAAHEPPPDIQTKMKRQTDYAAGTNDINIPAAVVVFVFILRGIRVVQE